MENLARDFHHPYKPYDIQFQLMNAIYDCIANGNIGIFESPTGPQDLVLPYNLYLLTPMPRDRM